MSVAAKPAPESWVLVSVAPLSMWYDGAASTKRLFRRPSVMWKGRISVNLSIGMPQRHQGSRFVGDAQGGHERQVRGREHGVLSLAVQCVDQSGADYGGLQHVELAVVLRDDADDAEVAWLGRDR